MKKNSLLPWIGLTLLGAAFLAVFVGVLDLRAGKGDIYPPYSANRHDPLGGSGVMEAFDRLPGVSAKTNRVSLMAIDELGENDALFLLGLPASRFSQMRVPDDSPVLQAIQEKGARLVITLHPEKVFSSTQLTDPEEDWMEKRRRLREEMEEKKKGENAEKKKNDNKKNSDDEEDLDEDEALEMNRDLGPKLTQRFKIEIETLKDFTLPTSGWATQSGVSVQGPLPNIPTWRSHYRFKIPEAGATEWKIAATAGNQPIIVERKLGKGSIALVSDSFFASNEALRQGGNGAFLLWLTGGKSRILFDETLHGSEDKPGVVKMLRQYRLHGILLGLLLFMVLWAWRSASSLAPGDEDLARGIIAGGGKVSGEDAQSGLVRLLRRNIPSKEILTHCLQNWRASQQGSLTPDQDRQLNEVMLRHLNNPTEPGVVSAYREITKILKRR